MSEARTGEPIDGHVSDNDPRRRLLITIDWGSDAARIGRIRVGTEYWGAVEWSNRRQAWCIEDVEGGCLAHAASIHGKAASKEAAEALAREMIRDGRMPSPQQAHADRLARQPAEEAARKRRREKRNHQPAQIRKREAARARQEAVSAAYDAVWKAEQQDKAQLPLLEALAEAFDLTDPELWKSNSWAMMRRRLVIHQRMVVAELEKDLAYAAQRAAAQPFAMYASNEQRKRQRAQRQSWGNAECNRLQQKLDRAREILVALEES
jgi:hypothetical protein